MSNIVSKAGQMTSLFQLSRFQNGGGHGGAALEMDKCCEGMAVQVVRFG